MKKQRIPLSSDNPFRRVVLSFTLCPALVGIFIFADFATYGPVPERAEMNPLKTIAASFGVGILSAVTGMIFYGLPAFGLALLYAYFRLKRCFQHVLFVCVAGGPGAQLRCEVLSLETIGNRYTSFFVGAATSFLMAFYVLPKQPEIQE